MTDSTSQEDHLSRTTIVQVDAQRGPMSLGLRQVVPGCPNDLSSQTVSAVQKKEGAFIVYASLSNVVVLDHELELVTTLSFWTALPHWTSSASASAQKVEGVLGVSSHGLIVAWSERHLVIWKSEASKSGLTQWATHSTLVASAPVTCIDLVEGRLAIGTRGGIELWSTDLGANVVIWDRLWERSYPAPSAVSIAPSLGNVAWFAKDHRTVHVLTLNSKGNVSGVSQELRHPREIQWIGWRKPKAASGDSHLYTITSNNVFRVYAPVLDDPAWFQLLATLDSRAFIQTTQSIQTKGSIAGTADGSDGSIWVMDATALRGGIAHALSDKWRSTTPDARRVLETLEAEECDVVCLVDKAGHISLRSILNMDRKPPTLLKSHPLVQTTISTGAAKRWSTPSSLIHDSTSGSLIAVSAPSGSDGRVSAVRLSIGDLLAGRGDALAPVGTRLQDETLPVQLKDPIRHFFRTPNGRGLLAMTETEDFAAFYKEKIGPPRPGQKSRRPLFGRGLWRAEEGTQDVTMFAKGRGIVSYIHTNDRQAITLQHLDQSSATPTRPIEMPQFDLDPDDTIEMLLAVSDIDDGYSGREKRTERAIIMAASKEGVAWIWRAKSKLDPARDANALSPPPDLELQSRFRLPVSSDEAPHLILPVDPMGWHQSVIDWHTDTPQQDMILTVTSDGILEFWTPWIGQHLAEEEDENEDPLKHARLHQAKGRHSTESWTKTGEVRTCKTGVIAARCSSRKKTVLVCELDDGRQELTIWDSKVSEFSTGLEHTWIYAANERVQDLDWTTTSDLQSVLAVGFAHKIVLICEQRMGYSEVTPGWAPFVTVDMTRYTSLPIRDSIWLAGGSLAVGCGNQVYLFSRFLERESPQQGTTAGLQKMSSDAEDPEDIFQMIAERNGPLVDYHPTVLAQSLTWDKVDLVKSILSGLGQRFKADALANHTSLRMPRLEPSAYYSSRASSSKTAPDHQRYDSLFDSNPAADADEADDFSQATVDDLIERLDGPVRVPLSEMDKSLLATVAQAALEMERQRRALDTCGMRYLLSIRMFANQKRRAGASGTQTPVSGVLTSGGYMPARSRLSFRNIVWAMHSESQDVLLSAATECCRDHKMLWPDAKRFGVLLWLKSRETIKQQMEILARNRFMQDEDRDPTSCSLIFFALDKKKVMHGLWRQAPGHKEQQAMLKFLANDFTDPRWKTAAQKNAYALLSKQRYEYAAAFFMLAGSPKDAITVCLRQLDDWQLAVALARVVEDEPAGPLLKWVMEDTVIPLAFAGGHRWLATWAFWMIGRRDLAVRVLISPMTEIAAAWSPAKTLDVGMPENDDPSLLLLFQYLKSKSLQTAKGTNEIAPKLEFDFVLHNARVFCRMGCHALALDLVRHWSFERPYFPALKIRPSTSAPMSATTATAAPSGLPPPSETSTPGHSPTRPKLTGSTGSSSFSRGRRPSFLLSSVHGRRESMFMDMDVLAESEAPTRSSSPPLLSIADGKPDSSCRADNAVEGDVPAKPAELTALSDQDLAPEPPKKVGNLMKELKQNVQQGAMEFSMDSFDF